MSQETRIWDRRQGFGPLDWDLSLVVGIWAQGLRFGPCGWDLGHEAKI